MGWGCVLVVCVGIVITQLGRSPAESAGASKPGFRQCRAQQFGMPNRVFGVLCLGVAALCSGSAGTLAQKLMQQVGACFWERNVVLASFSVLIALVQSSYSGGTSDSSVTHVIPTFEGFTYVTWLLVFVNACSAPLVGASLKYFDLLTKDVCGCLSMVLLTLLGAVLFGERLNPVLGFLGITLILIAAAASSGSLFGMKEKVRDSSFITARIVVVTPIFWLTFLRINCVFFVATELTRPHQYEYHCKSLRILHRVSGAVRDFTPVPGFRRDN